MLTRASIDSVETEKRGKALFEKARPLLEALDRNEKRSDGNGGDCSGGVLLLVRRCPAGDECVRSRR